MMWCEVGCRRLVQGGGAGWYEVGCRVVVQVGVVVQAGLQGGASWVAGWREVVRGFASWVAGWCGVM